MKNKKQNKKNETVNIKNTRKKTTKYQIHENREHFVVLAYSFVRISVHLCRFHCLLSDIKLHCMYVDRPSVKIEI